MRVVSRSARGVLIFWLTSLLLLSAAIGASRQDTAPTTTPVQTTYSGSDLFKTYCAACHGASAHGDGPLAANMKTPPPDLTRFARRNGGVFSSTLITRIIDGRARVKGHGGPDMPVWGDAFKASRTGSSEALVKERIDRLAEYLEGIQERPVR
jgi:mono/diheme cytochrome c family protein